MSMMVSPAVVAQQRQRARRVPGLPQMPPAQPQQPGPLSGGVPGRPHAQTLGAAPGAAQTTPAPVPASMPHPNAPVTGGPDPRPMTPQARLVVPQSPQARMPLQAPVGGGVSGHPNAQTLGGNRGQNGQGNGNGGGHGNGGGRGNDGRGNHGGNPGNHGNNTNSGNNGNPGEPVEPETPVNTSINDGRVDILNSLLGNPESMNQQWQDNTYQRIADARDLQMQDAQRQARERYGASADSNGALARELFDMEIAREGDLNGVRRDLSTTAATTNFADRQNVANMALSHQLGLGGLGLQQSQLENSIFNQDRAYQTQLAQMMMDMGMAGQNHESNLLGQLGGLVNSGLSYRDALAQLIFGQAQGRYADPGVSVAPQVSEASNPYLQYLMGQQQQDSGGGDMDWMSMAAQLGGMFF